jgi:hypothetical protein
MIPCHPFGKNGLCVIDKILNEHFFNQIPVAQKSE